MRTSNEHFYKEALPLWMKLYRDKGKIPNRINKEMVAVYTDYESDQTKPFTYLVGCEVSSLDQIPEGLKGLEIPAGNYTLFTATGAFPQSMSETWLKIWNSDIKRAYKTDFEVYGPDFQPQGKPEVKIYISTM